MDKRLAQADYGEEYEPLSVSRLKHQLELYCPLEEDVKVRSINENKSFQWLTYMSNIKCSIIYNIWLCSVKDGVTKKWKWAIKFITQHHYTMIRINYQKNYDKYPNDIHQSSRNKDGS